MEHHLLLLHLLLRRWASFLVVHSCFKSTLVLFLTKSAHNKRKERHSMIFRTTILMKLLSLATILSTFLVCGRLESMGSRSLKWSLSMTRAAKVFRKKLPAAPRLLSPTIPLIKISEVMRLCSGFVIAAMPEGFA